MTHNTWLVTEAVMSKMSTFKGVHKSNGGAGQEGEYKLYKTCFSFCNKTMPTSYFSKP